MESAKKQKPADCLAPAFRYPGGKQRKAKDFMEYVPEHNAYREPCAGAASLFFRKPKAAESWLNDPQPGLYAFYVALRDKPDQFIELCRRQEGDPEALFAYWAGRRDLMVASADDRIVERGVQYYYLAKTSFNGRVIYDEKRKSRLNCTTPEGWDNLEKKLTHLARVAQKLQGVKITCLSFEQCLGDVTPDTFCYLDPPYVCQSTCSRSDRLYDPDFPLEAHDLLAALLSESKAKIMLSYDDSPEVRKLYDPRIWRIVDVPVTCCGTYARTKEEREQGVKEKKARKRELLLMNY